MGSGRGVALARLACAVPLVQSHRWRWRWRAELINARVPPAPAVGERDSGAAPGPAAGQRIGHRRAIRYQHEGLLEHRRDFASEAGAHHLSKSGCACLNVCSRLHQLPAETAPAAPAGAPAAGRWSVAYVAAACTNSSCRSNCSALGGPVGCAGDSGTAGADPESTRVRVSSRASSCAWRSAFCWRSSASCFSVSRRLALSCLIRRLTKGTVAASSGTSASSPSDSGDAARLASSGGGASAAGGADSPCTPPVLGGAVSAVVPFLCLRYHRHTGRSVARVGNRGIACRPCRARSLLWRHYCDSSARQQHAVGGGICACWLYFNCNSAASAHSSRSQSHSPTATSAYQSDFLVLSASLRLHGRIALLSQHNCCVATCSVCLLCWSCCCSCWIACVACWT